MGNLYSRGSYEKDPLIRHLKRALRAIPVLPINPNLVPLRVLVKDSDGYHDVGSVASLSKAGEDKNWLQRVQNPTMLQNLLNKSCFQKKSIGEQWSHSLSADHGVVAKLLAGGEASSVAAWFERASSIEVQIPECWVHEFRKENWDEMMRHFDPDLMNNNSVLGKPDSWNGKRNLFIVQKVVLVSHIRITAKSETHSGLNLQTAAPVWLTGDGLQAGFSVRDSHTFEFTVSASKANRKLPIAFSGYRYTYDKFGVLESEHGKPTRIRPVAAARRLWLCRR